MYLKDKLNRICTIYESCENYKLTHTLENCSANISFTLKDTQYGKRVLDPHVYFISIRKKITCFNYQVAM